LLGLRVNMRKHNLFDTERDPSLLKPKPGGEARDIRQADGSHNDLGGPWLGMANARFGRNLMSYPSPADVVAADERSSCGCARRR
jgi:hypothetical protein